MVTTIQSMRTVVENELQHHGYTPSQFSELAGIRIEQLDYPRSVTIDQLDKIASVLGHGPGWLYELYLGQCFLNDKLTCSQQFSLAESLFEQGKKKEAIPLYRQIVDKGNTEDPQYVMSQFRLFQSLIGTGVEENREAVFRFETHYKHLPEDVRLDALLQMANVYYTFERWDKVGQYADELRELATAIYEKLIHNELYRPLQTERHLVVYYGQGCLMKGVALTKLEQYEEAKRCVQEYSDLSWFHGLDEVGKKEVEKFRIWGKGNRLILELNTGNLKVLPELSAYLDEYPNQILPSLSVVMKAANRYHFSVDAVLAKFEKRIPTVGTICDHINGTQLFHFWYEKVIYSFKRGGKHQALNELIHALGLAQKLRYYSGFEKCVSLFWKYVDHATEQQKKEYEKILEGVSA
ncbi:tetratricopeptide repeat protein [Paenibacillus elgii]|uniref:DNA-binding protein n=1 Tax=Paenibacillus elgii TaxID=189691 RepID=A0A2T6G6E6_9BACL|nr:helix-turn-helix transcriptional regulator [Paenibacillus elgii]NEN85925.1 DNA-binding protein [Paenibacillus elgii]PUA39730.1 DNA-binding protein [Paenibacillus elgii]